MFGDANPITGRVPLLVTRREFDALLDLQKECGGGVMGTNLRWRCRCMILLGEERVAGWDFETLDFLSPTQELREDLEACRR